MSFEIKRARGKTAVFSGARQHTDYIQRLEDLCIQKLLDNVNRIECIGDVPYYILRPLLTKIPVAQLRRIESFNPKIVDDEESDEPWKAHCERDYEGRALPEGWKWRDLYRNCERERDQKIEKITKRIKRHQEQDAKPIRQAMIVDQQLPINRNHAVSAKTVITKTIKNSSKLSGNQSGPSGSSNKIVIRREIHNGSQSKTTTSKSKAAPLMQKSMQLFKSRFRR